MTFRIFQPRPIMMYRPTSSSSRLSEQSFSIPPNQNPEFPPKVIRLVIEKTFQQKAREMMIEYQLQTFKNFGSFNLKPFGVHPDYPFIHPIRWICFIEVPEELKWFLWYFTHLYHISIRFSVENLKYSLRNAIDRNIWPEYQNFFTVLSCFHPLDQWLNMVTNEQMRTPRYEVVTIFCKPQYFVQCGRATQLGSFPTTWVHRIYPDEVTYSDIEYRNLQKYLCQLNYTILVKIWPPPDIEAHWDTVPDGLYYQQILQALQEYKAKIPDPSEWSQ
ncbi:hypothetical protein J1N35_007837 [Gossypium stocksii]|uniref:Uncharacterized protein n=1 Tax=Gossypium stocksii TaxID=47602 RepID=A0A9D3W6T4_9ROSI|nr:hypothetical protein J1N35_007837 [Gossypium stocksii]